ncbi:MAG: hypothetical protein HY805_07765 [Nitrospirae bacterium]|nr:hypothetical protein [Nitrospirota bacterium]
MSDSKGLLECKRPDMSDSKGLLQKGQMIFLKKSGYSETVQIKALMNIQRKR